MHDYVSKLIENLPDNFKTCKTPLRIDLVLDGGVFNGSYLVGALGFLKEMERRNYIKIERISGCSIGAMAAFLYYIDAMDLMVSLYETANTEFKSTHQMTFLKEFKQHVIARTPEDICERINGKLFVCFHNIVKGTKKTRCKFKNIDDLICTLIKSSFVPYLIDGEILYKNACIDGINPYMFDPVPHKQILHLDLFGYDKIGHFFNVKNEKTNHHRVLSGLLDIHSFFIKGHSTPMCSFVNEWSIWNKTMYRFKLAFERICVHIIYALIYMKAVFPNDTLAFKLASVVARDVCIVLLERYCI